jgi:hypothetical protein
MTKEKKDKVQALEAEIGRLFIKDAQLTNVKNQNAQLLQSKINELDKLKQEK